MSNPFSGLKLPAIFVFVWLMVLCYWYLSLRTFGFYYVDADQAVMWQGLLDFSANTWHEPRFYGQNYNSLFEALLAVPLYKLGVPPHVALPVITAALCLLSFFLFFLEAYQTKKYVSAFVFSIMPLLLPTKYSFIASLPRGFIPGIFLAALSVFRSSALRNPKASFRFGFLSVVAMSLNPNALFILAPIFIERLPSFFKSPVAIKFFVLGVLPATVLHLLASYYYVVHPEAVVHPLIGDNFLLERYPPLLANLDSVFNPVTPIFWNMGFLILLIFLLFAILLLKKAQYVKAVACLVVWLGLVGSLGIGKTSDGTSSVIFPYARLFLAIPLTIALVLDWLLPEIKMRMRFLLLPALFFFIHTYQLMAENAVPSNYLANDVIAVDKVYKLKEGCGILKSLSKKNKVELILFFDSYFKDLYNYGCACCTTEFPITLRARYERRTWLLKKYENTVFKSVMLVDSQKKFEQIFPNQIEKITDDYFLLKNNTYTTKELLQKLNN